MFTESRVLNLHDFLSGASQHVGAPSIRFIQILRRVRVKRSRARHRPSQRLLLTRRPLIKHPLRVPSRRAARVSRTIHRGGRPRAAAAFARARFEMRRGRVRVRARVDRRERTFASLLIARHDVRASARARCRRESRNDDELVATPRRSIVMDVSTAKAIADALRTAGRARGRDRWRRRAR